MKEISESIFEEFISDLEGSCSSSDDVSEKLGFDFDDLSAEQLEEMDEKIFCCTQCGWWYESSGIVVISEWYCENCSEDVE